MRISARLKKIEDKLLQEEQNWVIFSIADYSDPQEKKLAEESLVKAYMNQGNPYPTRRIFLREIPKAGAPL